MKVLFLNLSPCFHFVHVFQEVPNQLPSTSFPFVLAVCWFCDCLFMPLRRFSHQTCQSREETSVVFPTYWMCDLWVKYCFMPGVGSLSLVADQKRTLQDIAGRTIHQHFRSICCWWCRL